MCPPIAGCSRPPSSTSMWRCLRANPCRWPAAVSPSPSGSKPQKPATCCRPAPPWRPGGPRPWSMPPVLKPSLARWPTSRPPPCARPAPWNCRWPGSCARSPRWPCPWAPSPFWPAGCLSASVARKAWCLPSASSWPSCPRACCPRSPCPWPWRCSVWLATTPWCVASRRWKPWAPSVWFAPIKPAPSPPTAWPCRPPGPPDPPRQRPRLLRTRSCCCWGLPSAPTPGSITTVRRASPGAPSAIPPKRPCCWRP